MIELQSCGVFARIVSFDRKRQKQMQVAEDVYRQTEAMGCRIEPDSYDGFELLNRSQGNVNRGLPYFPKEFVQDIPIDQQKSANPISVMSRGNNNNFIALIPWFHKVCQQFLPRTDSILSKISL